MLIGLSLEIVQDFPFVFPFLLSFLVFLVSFFPFPFLLFFVSFFDGSFFFLFFFFFVFAVASSQWLLAKPKTVTGGPNVIECPWFHWT